ncbi:MAG: LptF/LptG family permease [Treponema sp.]|nr:LptF/LptG family permease [Treponema sp.]
MTLDRYVAQQFFPVFFVSLLMFMLSISMIDLFSNLARYLTNEASLANIFRVSFYYLPKSFSYSMPIALIFAAAYLLGDLYARNELTSVFAAGIPFWRFSAPLVIIALGASFFSFIFDDQVVIPTLRVKNQLSRELLHQQRPENRADIVVKAQGGNLIYAVDYFDGRSLILNGLSIIEHDGEGSLLSLVRSPRAVWTGEHWELVNPVVYQWERELLLYHPLGWTDEYREDPETFRRSMMEVEELNFRDARHLVEDLRIAGLPYVHELADYYHRFSFASAPLVVMILSISMGGRFRKNIVLMSLLSSIGTAVVFYVMEMISMMLARLGYIPPLIGAWFPVFTFIGLGLFLVRSAKT